MRLLHSANSGDAIVGRDRKLLLGQAPPLDNGNGNRRTYPHWSNELMPQIQPWVKILCSYMAVRSALPRRGVRNQGAHTAPRMRMGQLLQRGRGEGYGETAGGSTARPSRPRDD